MEIVKREHMERLKAKRLSLVGVHQYNEFGALHSPCVSSPDLTAETLSGSKLVAFFGLKNSSTNDVYSVKIKKTVFMRITLSRKELHHLVDRGAT